MVAIFDGGRVVTVRVGHVLLPYLVASYLCVFCENSLSCTFNIFTYFCMNIKIF